MIYSLNEGMIYRYSLSMSDTINAILFLTYRCFYCDDVMAIVEMLFCVSLCCLRSI